MLGVIQSRQELKSATYFIGNNAIVARSKDPRRKTKTLLHWVASRHSVQGPGCSTDKTTSVNNRTSIGRNLCVADGTAAKAAGRGDECWIGEEGDRGVARRGEASGNICRAPSPRLTDNPLQNA
jgi:hypothetical protein